MDLNVAWAACGVASLRQYVLPDRAAQNVLTICTGENGEKAEEEGDVRVQSRGERVKYLKRPMTDLSRILYFA